MTPINAYLVADPTLVEYFNFALTANDRLSLTFKFLAEDGQPVNPTGLRAFVVLQSRLGSDPTFYSLTVVSAPDGTASVDIPANTLSDVEGYNIEVKYYPTSDNLIYTIVKGRIDVMQGIEYPSSTEYDQITPA